MLVAVGHSTNPATEEAVEDIITQCRQILGKRKPGLGLWFTSRMDVDFGAVARRILAQWPDLPLAGCTTDGEISDVFPSTEDSLGLLLIHSERLRFRIGSGEGLSENPEQTVRQAFDQARGDEPGSFGLGLVLCEGLRSIRIDLGAAMRSVLGDGLPLFGACAGDHYEMRQTFQFHGDQVLSNAVVLILISGPVRFSMDLLSGWNPIGPAYPVTGARDNVIREIDGMPARGFLRKYLGAFGESSAQFPLAVLTGDKESDFVLRDPYIMHEHDGSVEFVGTFPDHPRVRLTEFSREGLLLAAENAAQNALSRYPGGRPALALLFPCTSRRHILGSQAAREQAYLGRFRREHPGLRFFGMYAYGEIGPVGVGGPACFHNDTYAVLLLGEG